ncbi:MAG TPA: glycosyltransferase, partial [Opitutaceae bacterium]|nr:glycosyltransferase [Opitutaceae bacterium]
MKPPLSTPKYALSFVIPLYQSAGPIRTVVKELERLLVDGGHEIILVNDGSPDATASVCRELIREALVPMIYVQHARNFGEHNAVLTGWRYAQGEWIVNLDDDGQNPPAEALRLFQHAKTTELDVIYGDYASKQHAAWRNVGSRFTNWITDRLLDKPAGFYLSSFRCVRGSIAREAARYDGPFPYIDGLLLQITQNIGSIEVQHKARADGQSSYTLKKLLRLWLSTVVNFSVLPLRIASIIGSLLALGGLLGIV